MEIRTLRTRWNKLIRGAYLREQLVSHFVFLWRAIVVKETTFSTQEEKKKFAVIFSVRDFLQPRIRGNEKSFNEKAQPTNRENTTLFYASNIISFEDVLITALQRRCRRRLTGEKT